MFGNALVADNFHSLIPKGEIFCEILELSYSDCIPHGTD